MPIRAIPMVPIVPHEQSQEMYQALQILFKRLAPVSAYPNLPQLSAKQIGDLVQSIGVEREQYSTTRYIANLDIYFSPQGVQQVLQSNGIPISTARAQPIKILPIVIDASMKGSDPVKPQGDEGWQDAWLGLDLAHSLTPAEIVAPGAGLTLDQLNKVLSGDVDAYDSLQAEYGRAPLLIAIAERAKDPKEGDVLITRLYGDDAVGDINYGDKDPIVKNDLRTAAQTAAARDFGVIENRWKVMQSPQGASQPGANGAQAGGQYQNGQTYGQGASGQGAGGQDYGQAPQPGYDSGNQTASAKLGVTPRNVVAEVQFQGLAGWQDIRSKLASVPGVQNLDVNSISPQGASVTFDYAGSLGTLQQVLAQNGLAFEESRSGFVLHSQ